MFVIEWFDGGSWQFPGCEERDARCYTHEEAEETIRTLRRDAEWADARFRVRALAIPDGDEGEAWLRRAVLRSMAIHRAGGVVRVIDGWDRWICWEADWQKGIDAVREGALTDADPYDLADAYARFCELVPGPMLSLVATNRGSAPELAALVGAARAVGWGVDPDRYRLTPEVDAAALIFTVGRSGP